MVISISYLLFDTWRMMGHRECSERKFDKEKINFKSRLRLFSFHLFI